MEAARKTFATGEDMMHVLNKRLCLRLGKAAKEHPVQPYEKSKVGVRRVWFRLRAVLVGG
jgi:hypothetical protein